MAVQAAGVAALGSWAEFVPANAAVFRARRDAAVESFRAAGFECAVPRATMYLWVKLPEGVPSAGFADRLLEKKSDRPAGSVWAGRRGLLRYPYRVRADAEALAAPDGCWQVAPRGGVSHRVSGGTGYAAIAGLAARLGRDSLVVTVSRCSIVFRKRSESWRPAQPNRERGRVRYSGRPPPSAGVRRRARSPTRPDCDGKLRAPLASRGIRAACDDRDRCRRCVRIRAGARGTVSVSARRGCNILRPPPWPQPGPLPSREDTGGQRADSAVKAAFGIYADSAGGGHNGRAPRIGRRRNGRVG